MTDRIGSLCTGTGALDVAAPGTLAWVADHDPFADLTQAHE